MLGSRLGDSCGLSFSIGHFQGEEKMSLSARIAVIAPMICVAALLLSPAAEAKLIHHITSGEKAKFPDGHEEDHKIVKTDPPNDMAQIKNLVDWILEQ